MEGGPEQESLQGKSTWRGQNGKDCASRGEATTSGGR